MLEIIEYENYQFGGGKQILIKIKEEDMGLVRSGGVVRFIKIVRIMVILF